MEIDEGCLSSQSFSELQENGNDDDVISSQPKAIMGEGEGNSSSSSSAIGEDPPTAKDGSVLMYWFDACEGEKRRRWVEMK